jgi:hypothetical protein
MQGSHYLAHEVFLQLYKHTLGKGLGILFQHFQHLFRAAYRPLPPTMPSIEMVVLPASFFSSVEF